MSCVLLARADTSEVYHASHVDLLAALPRREDGTVCDALIFDAPYSEKTHKGHVEGAQTANRAKDWARRSTARDSKTMAEARYAAAGKGERRKINYAHWTEADVRQCVALWSPAVRGWFVTITDGTLAPIWIDALTKVGRYTFDSLPYVAPGSRVRMSRDGPSCWTCWIVVGEAAESIGDRVVVGRPRCREYATWGTLPGAYVLPPGEAVDMPVVGGKPPWLMERLVEDYSRLGDLVCDITCGAGTTLRAAQKLGRRSVGCDNLLAHAQLAAGAILKPYQSSMYLERHAEQRSLFEGQISINRGPNDQD